MSREAGTLDPRQIAGVKRLRHLLPLLAPLHDVGCERDAAGNRELHFDEYVTLLLLYLMNPMIDSVWEERRVRDSSSCDGYETGSGILCIPFRRAIAESSALLTTANRDII